ncbi:hypothetical protein CQW23_17317 [Capsicum baccatum]|uniref:Ubiquitin-like protease family profile domain-containing protein n=1 Tax=Capsicum baccatum TaxID=33114 RepID=A0A2G2WDJ5_CAPBA|nr:hypothetical protein CQW23_17317 [Capsicum baccatum]
MNRESGPSFSLGFSQLESIKESQQVVSFVPGDFDYEIDDFHESRSKHRNDPSTMKKLHQKFAKKDKKKESDSKKRGSNSLASKAPAKRRRIVKEICRDELPKELSYVIKEMPTHPLRFLNASPVLFSDFKMVEDGKYQFFPWDTEEKSKVDADSTSINMKDLLTKADLHSLESEMKTYVKTYIDKKFKDLKRVMNDRFTEILKSLQQKMRLWSSSKEGQHSDDDADFECHTNSISPHPVSEKNRENGDVAKDLATQDAAARTDEVHDIEMSLINTIKGWSTHAGRPWDMVNEVFVPINCDGIFHWVLTVIALKDRCIRVYDSMASSRKKHKQVRLKNWL